MFKMYYDPERDLLGILEKGVLLRVVSEEHGNIYIPLTYRWIEVGMYEKV